MKPFKLPLAAFVTLGTITLAQAQTVWNMPTPYADGAFHTQNIRSFADDVEKATEGRLKLQVHSGGSLYKNSEIKGAVRSGLAPIGEFLLSNIGPEHKIFEIDLIPFLSSNYMESKALYDASRELIQTKLDEQGLQLLFSVPWPPQSLYTNREVASLKDVEGLKIRAYNQLSAQLVDMLKGVPVTIDVSDIPQAFSTGVVEAMTSSAQTGVTSKAWDYVNRFYVVNAWMPRNAVVVSKRELARLADGDREALFAAAAAAESRGWEMSEQADSRDIGTLTENGMTVEPVSAEFLAELREVGLNLLESWSGDADEPTRAVIENYLATKK